MKKLTVAITGASGAIYAHEFMKLLAPVEDVEVHGLISEAGEKVLDLELGLAKEDLAGVKRWYDVKDFTAPMASGSAGYHAMAVLPCTMGTLAAISAGLSQNLIHRAADVILKERLPLVLAVRETPLNRNHLKNMLSAHEAGATICPAMPGFYQGPETLEAMARNFAARVAEQLGVAVDYPRWQGVE
ncbi:MAG: UbiX family flavin prenyltransferase [Thermodesulfobacteriota bacterium]